MTLIFHVQRIGREIWRIVREAIQWFAANLTWHDIILFCSVVCSIWALRIFYNLIYVPISENPALAHPSGTLVLAAILYFMLMFAIPGFLLALVGLVIQQRSLWIRLLVFLLSIAPLILGGWAFEK